MTLWYLLKALWHILLLLCVWIGTTAALCWMCGVAPSPHGFVEQCGVQGLTVTCGGVR